MQDSRPHLKTLSDPELHSRAQRLAAEERRVTLDVLRHLREVERRRLFASRGYPPLFAYCVAELRYSEASAARRLSAIRSDPTRTQKDLARWYNVARHSLVLFPREMPQAIRASRKARICLDVPPKSIDIGRSRSSDSAFVVHDELARGVAFNSDWRDII